MKRLTKKERDVLIRAANRIDKGLNVYSCTAISNIESGAFYYESKLVQKYRNFYCPRVNIKQLWIDESGEVMQDKEWRIMCLLFFAEGG